MRALLSALVLALALPAAAQQRGTVSGVGVSSEAARTGTLVTITVTGSNPCGAVHIDYGDGAAVTHPITGLPATVTYTYLRPGTYRVQARGMGNCDGREATTVRVVGPAIEPPSAEPARSDTMRFRGMDRNGDGVITRAEWRGSDRSFSVHDWNRDRILSGDEVRVGARRDERVDDFASLDRNGDGRLTRAEWRYEAETFLRADRNRDGVLTRAEFLGEDIDDDRDDRFNDLDLNRNGRIERSEWHGGAEAFAWLDRNNDGAISRSEALGDAVVGTTGQVVVVEATERWTDTGVVVQAGDVLRFDAEGTIWMTPGSSDAAVPAGSRAGRRAPGAPFPDRPAGALIARIGDGAALFIGGQTAVRAPAGGRLDLGVNDDYLGDNRGAFRVRVTVER